MIITISREAATNGGMIGRLVAERLHIPVYDRELVDEVARRLHVEPTILTHFDETVLNPVSSMLWEWRASINEQIYRRYLTHALHRIAAEGSAVVIGRGATFVLRCPDCLHVRIVAPIALRVAIYQTIYDVTAHDAERAIHKEDREKASFIRTVYNAAIAAPENYDLVLNLASTLPEAAADLIVFAAQQRAHTLVQPDPHTLLPAHITEMLRHRRPVRREIVERHIVPR